MTPNRKKSTIAESICTIDAGEEKYPTVSDKEIIHIWQDGGYAEHWMPVFHSRGNAHPRLNQTNHAER
jgi:hypothetical protein